ncbi:MAG: hypothetical protein V7K14_13140 [Nostoc sp.]|uniref:hypothetical protein n=1 Tax=Nostoc sp. TaxID=1180 RepID=UPI002FF83AE7
MSKLIRRALIASGLFIGTAVAFSPTAFAGTTASATIGGNVTSTIAITASTGKANVDLAPDQNTVAVKVSDLAMGTNSVAGLTLTTSGTFNLDNQRTTIPFLVGVGVGATNAPVNYGASGNAASGIDTGAAAAPNTPYGLWIQYSTATGFQDPGAYGATINLSVADN